MWGKSAEDFDASSQPIVALKGAKLSDFGGRSLSSLASTVLQVRSFLTSDISIMKCSLNNILYTFQVNPDMPEAHKMRGWFDNVGSSAVTASISTARGAGSGGGGSFKTFAEAKFENLGGGEKPDYYSVKAMVAMINKERALYMACPTDDCNKKVGGNPFQLEGITFTESIFFFC